ncbi:MAG TPA: POTRA domain-containing protein [Candidatus Acidoferrales bacterium]|nr:POTRA domain-containing protein [Candidatus Acidoferrales bacterium]
MSASLRSRQNASSSLSALASTFFLAGVLWLVGGLPALAQQTTPSAYAGFEGRKVSSVNIAIRPQITDVTAFRKLIEQKSGAPFSMKAIRESVAALQKTKLFSQVQVKITPEVSGLRVLFLLQPAYFVGLISFPGATKRFAYTELLEAVNIPAQSAFTNDLLPQGQKALLAFFSKQGYFKATVRSQAQVDDAHRIENLVFTVELGPRARIGAINFEGLSDSQAQDMRNSLSSWWARLKRDSLRRGQKYSQPRIGKATGLIANHFESNNRLVPVVRLAGVSYDPQTNLANITFRVDLGPSLSVQVTGAHVSRGTLKKLVPVYEEGAVDQDLIDEGQRNLVAYFQNKGYFSVSMHWHLHREADRDEIVYQVNLGERHKVAGISFKGNGNVDDAKLHGVVAVKAAEFPFFSRGTFSDDLLKKSEQAVTAIYQSMGYANAKVRADVNTKEKNVHIVFVIEEGPLDRVNSIEVKGNKTESLSALLPNGQLHVRKGQAYSPRDVQSDRNALMAAYLNRGYLNAQFKFTATPENGNPHLVNVVYDITEGPRTFITSVVLLGTVHTSDAFLRNLTHPYIDAGQPLSMGNMFKAESTLYNLGIFDWARIQPRQPITTETQAEVLEQVHEEPRNEIEYGGGIEVIPKSGNIPIGTIALPGLPPIGLGTKFRASQESLVSPRGTFGYTRRNIFGRAESFSASTVMSRLVQRGDLSFTNTHFLGSSWSSLVSATGERTSENPVFSAELGIGSWQFQKALNAKRTENVILRYDFDRTLLSNITIPDLVPPSDQRVRLSTVSGELIRDTRDHPLDAHHGVYQVVDFGVTSTPLGSSADFVRFLGQAAFYHQVRPWLVWANNFRVGFASPFAGSHIPLSEEFFSGGADSLRGFPIDGAGPQRPVQVCSDPAVASTCTVISVPVGGESLFIFNTEARFPIPWVPFSFLKGLGGAVFYDGGNVYAHINLPQMVNNYTNTIGFGFRYNTPVGPVRFDIGHNFNPVPGVSATQYFVTLGQAF